MSKKETQKKREVNIEEEKDFYLSFVNKKLRNIRKRLEQIEALSSKDESTLKPEQIEKLRSKSEVLASMKHFEELKDIYYSAYKLGLDEGKISLPERSSEVSSEKNDQAPEAPKVEKEKKSEVIREPVNIGSITEQTIVETLNRVVNLLSVGQFFEMDSSKETYLRDNQQTLDLDGKINELLRVYRVAFNVKSEDQTLSLSDNREKILSNLTEYVKADLNTNEAYNNVSKFAESVVASDSFKNFLVNNSEKKTQPKPDIQENVPEKQNIIYELLPGAALLKPDTDDVNKSPETMKYLPKDIKTIKYVDELEREQNHNGHTEETNDQNSLTNQKEQDEGQVLKESVDGPSQNSKNKPEGGQERSFRKNKPKYNEGTYNPQRKTANHKENRSVKDEDKAYVKPKTNKTDSYHKRREYEVREYVEKRPAEKKV